MSTPSPHGGKTMSRKLHRLAALVVIALISTGCRKAQAETGSNDTKNAAHTQAVKFAGCMRDNGISAFPDPEASGELTIDQIANGSSLDTNTEAFKQAVSACKDLEPAGFTGGKRSPEQQSEGLKFAQCIRDNGVKDFPDPVNGEPLVDTNRVPSSNQPGGMDMLNAAMRKCRALGPQ